MKFASLLIHINPAQIAFLKFIIEGYDGLATVTTVDRKAGVVRLAFPETRKSELYGVIKELFPEESAQLIENNFTNATA